MPIFAEEENNRHAAVSTNAQVYNQFAVHLTLDKAQTDLRRITLRNASYERPLLDTIAAPDSAVDQDLHLSHKPTEQLLLLISLAISYTCV